MTDTSSMSWRDPRMIAAIVLVAAIAIVAALISRPEADSADLLAVWTAGEFWKMGRLAEIYPAADGLFTMTPPAAWVDWLAAGQDYHGSVFPFLYPPLWAVAMAAIAPAEFGTVASVALWINAGLIAATVILAIRATGAALHPVLHVAAVLLIFLMTQIASVGFLQGQPHILVSFLLVLTVERSRAGAGRMAGVALALAASIKLFPALFVVIWLARGERRPLVAFALAGAALAGASVLLAGWPLHRAFLDSVSQIGGALLLTAKSVSFDALVGQLFLLDETVVVTGTYFADGTREVWRIAARPPIWASLSSLGLIAVLVGTALAARRASSAALYTGLWPLALTLSVLFAPTGWLYYHIPAAVFAPAMIARLPRPRGAALFLIGLLFFWAGRLIIVEEMALFPIAEVFFFVAGALVWSLGFGLCAALKSDATPDQALRPVAPSL
jgi:hypothetical protein